MEVVMREDEMRTVNECYDILLLHISANDSVENFEKGDGCVVLDYALILKK
jgi:hypothetical protein